MYTQGMYTQGMYTQGMYTIFFWQNLVMYTYGMYKNFFDKIFVKVFDEFFFFYPLRA